MPPEDHSPSAAWLVLTLPGVLLAGRWLAGTIRTDLGLSWLLSPTLGVASWLIAVNTIGRVAGSFWCGLWWGTIGVAALGILGLAPFVRRPPDGSSDNRAGPRDRPWAMGLSALAATVVVAPVVLGWAFHDELHYTGHLSIASEMLRDVYPPRHLSFPQFELRYHYGFNLLVAAVAAIGRMPVVPAVDVVTLACRAHAWCLLWAIGERIVGPRGGPITAFVTLFGAGLPWLAPRGGESETFRLLGLINVNGSTLNPPMVSYFFQHPWTLGLPLGLAAILIHVVEPGLRGRGPGRLAAMAILLTALAMSQFVLFACLGASLAVAETLAGGRPTARGTASMLLMLGMSAVVASRLGGFFLPPDRGEPPQILLYPWVAGSAGPSLLWMVATYGLLLPLGLAGLALIRNGRLLLSLLIAGGLLVVNLFRYRYSWDILKFGTVASLALSIASGASVTRIFALRTRAMGLSLGTALTVGVTAAGLGFTAAFGLRLEGIPRDIYPERPATLAADDEPVLRWLRLQVAPGEIVYRRIGVAPAYAQLGGLPQAWFDQASATFDFARWRFPSRARLLAILPDDPGAFLSQRIRWFVVDPEDAQGSALVDNWILTGRAEEVARFGAIRIARLHATSSHK